MKLHNFKLWFGFLIAIVILSFLLFQQSNRNKLELEEQAVNNMQLVKSRLKGTYESILSENLARKKREDKAKGETKEIKIEEITFDWHKKDSLARGEFGFCIMFTNRRDTSFAISSLFVPFLKQKFFEQLVLSADDGSILFPKKMAGQRLTLENLNPKQHALLPIIKNTIKKDNEAYFVYTTPIEMGGSKFHLHGLISQDYFERIGKKVDFTIITILVFVLALMLYSLPLFSFFGLGRGDTLTRLGVYLVGLSLIGIMLVMGFGTAFFKDHHPVSDEEHGTHLDSIQFGLKKALGERKKILESGDSTKIEHYDVLLQIDNSGKTKKFLNKGKPDPYTEQWDLTHRQYYTYFKKNLNSSKSETHKYYLGAHYSLVNSNRVAIISTLTNHNDVSAIAFEARNGFTTKKADANYLVFKADGLLLTSSDGLKIIADSVSQLLPAYQWAEIKSLIKTNKENQDGGKWNISTYLDGHAMAATLFQLNSGLNFDQSVWVLYLIDEHLEHGFSSLVTYESAVFVVLYMVVLAILSMINKLVRPKSKRLDSKMFAYSYLYPKYSKRLSFIVLICFLVINFAWILYFFHLDSVHFIAMFIILVISTVHIKSLMFVWLFQEFEIDDEKRKEDPLMGWMCNRFIFHRFFSKTFISKTFVISLGLMAVLLAILFYYLDVQLANFMVGWFFAWVALSVFGSLLARQWWLKILSGQGNAEKEAAEPEGPVAAANLFSTKQYPIFLLFWIFSIGFLPGYIMFKKVYQFEKQKWQTIATLDSKSPSGQNPDRIGNVADEQKTTASDFWDFYDEWRRDIFGNLNTVMETEVYDFIEIGSNSVQLSKLDGFWNHKYLDEKFDHIENDTAEYFWLTVLFLGAMALFFALVRELSLRIYLLRNIGVPLSKGGEESQFSPISKLVFICGVDDTRFPDWIDKKFDFKGDYLFETNCLSNPTLEFGIDEIKYNKNIKVWLVSHIHCLSDQQTVMDKLPAIIAFCSSRNLKLIVTSGISWKYLLRSFKNESKEITYSQMFSDFQLEYVPLTAASQGRLEAAYKTEQEASEYVRSRKPYFFNIWEEMSLEEKKVCYDFSLYDFFNYTNYSVIAELRQKGILTRQKPEEELPKLFSVFFRQFIRNNISDAEKESFRAFEKRNGNAGSIQIAVFSFLLLSVALISYFDKNFLDQATTYVSGTVGALGGLYSLVSKGLINIGSSKKPAE